MTNEIRLFENEKFGKVRVVEHDGKPWFVGKDVAQILGYTKPDAMYRIVDKEYKIKINPQTIENTGFPQNGVTLESNPNVKNLILINESGLYSAIFNSKLPAAKEFKHWVTSEVLPSIRKTGSYSVNEDVGKSELIRANSERASLLLKIATDVDTKSTEWKNILKAKAAEILAGEPILPLPKSTHGKTLSATEVGKILGISANRVGKLANKHNLKTPTYGEYYRSKSKYSDKEVDTWVYYENIIPKLKEYLE